jgi:hypothetical protein
MQRAVKRSQWQGDDRSLIRRMVRAGTFLNIEDEHSRVRTRKNRDR